MLSQGYRWKQTDYENALRERATRWDLKRCDWFQEFSKEANTESIFMLLEWIFGLWTTPVRKTWRSFSTYTQAPAWPSTTELHRLPANPEESMGEEKCAARSLPHTEAKGPYVLWFSFVQSRIPRCIKTFWPATPRSSFSSPNKLW